ncbi:hypothetical protein ROZALSC1DRAFT_28440, partial [Rozella allomycis CSF55]
LPDLLRDSKDLEEYLTSYESPSKSITSSIPQFLVPLQRYFSASSQSPSIKRDSSKHSLITKGQDEVKICSINLELFEKLNATLKQDILIENMRKWFSNHLLHLIIQSIDEVESEFKRMGLQNLGILYETSTNASALHDLAKTNQAAKTRLFIEQFLSFASNKTHREYILQRIRDLEAGSVLANFKWNEGGYFNGQPYSPAFPTDAELLMSLFCVFLDYMLTENDDQLNTKRAHPFTSKYFVEVSGGKIARLNEYIQIRQVKKSPPQYHLVINNVIYEIENGRNNLMLTIACFVEYVKQEYFGFIE